MKCLASHGAANTSERLGNGLAPLRAVRHKPPGLAAGVRVGGHPLQALTGSRRADIEPMTGHPEGQGCRASLHPVQDFCGVAILEQVRQGGGEHGGDRQSVLGLDRLGSGHGRAKCGATYRFGGKA